MLSPTGCILDTHIYGRHCMKFNFFSESEIGEFDDGLDDELMGDEEDRRTLEGE